MAATAIAVQVLAMALQALGIEGGLGLIVPQGSLT